MGLPARRRLRLSGGTELSFITAGEVSNPALLLLHGFPSSARTFRGIIPGLAASCHVIAPDLPGYGESGALAAPSFQSLGTAVTELLGHLAAGPRFIYLHDWGAPVGLQVAMQAPELVRGLIIQNANAHRSGFGPLWQDTFDFWANPTKENEARVTSILTLEGTRDQYTSGVPQDIVAQIRDEPWIGDWQAMNLPGHMETQRALLADYASHVARFEAIAAYLRDHQPPALLLWGRHDAFFDIAETLSWMQALPRMEAHVFDAGHFLLETHAEAALALMTRFVRRTGLPAA